MNQTSQSPLDSIRSDIERLIRAGRTDSEIAHLIHSLPDHYNIKTSARSIHRARRRWGYEEPTHSEEPGLKIEGDEAEVVSDPYDVDDPMEYPNLSDTDALLRERGLDPDEWEVVNIIVSEWGGLLNINDNLAVKNGTQKTRLKQLKLHLKRKKPFSIVIPARVNLDLPEFKGESLASDEPRLVVLVGDQQAPYHNVRLHRLFLDWLDENRPDDGVLLGDTIDLPKISRHPDDPEWAATTQECVDAGGQIILDYTLASRRTKWTKLPGNHDERLRRAVIDRLGDFYGLRPAQVESLPNHPPIHDPVFLLRLDELGVEYVRPKGSYDHAAVKLSDNLAARHGWIARKGSGASAHATLDHLGHSVVVGHTHRQGHVFQTKYDVDGKASTITAVETGCMCRIEEGLGYAVAPDWQNGFATATVWPDGKFHLELATYVDGTLLYQDQRYS